MIENFQMFFDDMTLVEIVEYGSVVILLVLGLLIFFRSSTPVSKFFIPICCLLAAVIQLANWAHFGDEPSFMTPVVQVVSAWIS